MNEREWSSDVRQEEWTLELTFRWLEETAAFLYLIRKNSRSPAAHHPEPDSPQIVATIPQNPANVSKV